MNERDDISETIASAPFTPSNPAHPDHQMPWHTEACFQASTVIACDSETDKRRCLVCGKEWEEACNFDDDYA